MRQINSAVSQLSQTTQLNAASSEELAATSEEMSTQAEHLAQLMDMFKRYTGEPSALASRAARPAPGHPVLVKTVTARGAAARHSATASVDETHFTRF